MKFNKNKNPKTKELKFLFKFFLYIGLMTTYMRPLLCTSLMHLMQPKKESIKRKENNNHQQNIMTIMGL